MYPDNNININTSKSILFLLKRYIKIILNNILNIFIRY
jgi:hypothetical protein